jgi:hypothetical protein
MSNYISNCVYKAFIITMHIIGTGERLLTSIPLDVLEDVYYTSFCIYDLWPGV